MLFRLYNTAPVRAKARSIFHPCLRAAPRGFPAEGYCNPHNIIFLYTGKKPENGLKEILNK